MGRKADLKREEKQRIDFLSHGKNTLNILKLIHRDHRTVKRFIENSNKVREGLDKGKFRKISRCKISSMKRTDSKSRHSTSAKISREAGVPLRSIAGRCKILGGIGKVAKPKIKPPLKQRHKLARLDGAKSYMKNQFRKFFSWRVSANSGSSRWMNEWLATRSPQKDQATKRRSRCYDLCRNDQ